MLMPSHFARTSPLLDDLARELGVDRADGRDPLTLVRDVNHRHPQGVRVRPQEHGGELADRGEPELRGRACARTSRTS